MLVRNRCACQTENGIGLIVFMLILLVFSLGLLSSSTSAGLQQKIASNYHQASNCLLSAESAALVSVDNITALSQAKFVSQWTHHYDDIIPHVHAQPTTTSINYLYSSNPSGFSLNSGIVANHFAVRSAAISATSPCPLDLGIFRLGPS